MLISAVAEIFIFIIRPFGEKLAGVSEGEASVSAKIRISNFRCCLRIFSGTKRWVRFLERR